MRRVRVRGPEGVEHGLVEAGTVVTASGARIYDAHGRPANRAVKVVPLSAAQLEKGRDLARKTLEQLDGLRVRLQARLEEELERAELRWPEADASSETFRRLRAAAQGLADQLSQVEELEERIERMLQPQAPDRDS